ncbi:MAG: hypothetical protein ACRESZ_09480, partial [Methylococcales bacterium]
GRAHRAFFCRIDNNQVPGLNITTPAVLFHKRSTGGSAQGVNPLLDGVAIDAMVINNGNCTRVGTTQEWLCRISNAGDLTKVFSNAGVSDVEPGLFFSINTPAGFQPVKLSDVAQKLTVRSAAALVFGIPVTKSLRDALQEVQKNAGLIRANCAIGDDTQPCMPSLSTQQISSILFGAVKNWDQIHALNSAKILTPFTQALSIVAQPQNKLVAICRRVPGSGTQAQANAVFLNAPCSRTALRPITQALSNPVTGPIVVENSGSGDVRLCLNDFNNGTNLSGVNPSLQKFWAVGIQSTENNADLADDYRYIKVDRVAPTLKNAANGTYKDWVELTYQWRKDGQAGAPGANQLAILETIVARAGGPEILGALNLAKFFHPFGVAGYLALTVNGHRLGPNGAFNLNNPVTPYTHIPRSAINLSNCRVPVYDSEARDVNGNIVFPL